MKLDYNIITATERCAAVTQNQDQLLYLPPSQLEKVANYILYGKDDNGEKLPEAKEIGTKHATWKRKSPESLEALMDLPSFDESELRPFNKRSVYTNPKPTISRETDRGIPGMLQLWEAIDIVAAELEKEEETNGKSLRGYYLRHHLIDLRKEQYHLKHLFKPQVSFTSAAKGSVQTIDWSCDTGYAVEPLTLAPISLSYSGTPDWTWRTVAEHTIELTNRAHIRHILSNYSRLKQFVHDKPTCDTAFLLLAVECLISKANLAPSRYDILVQKIDSAPNEKITENLRLKYGLTYAPNYISTIWTQEICGAIARAAATDLEEIALENQPDKWKTCQVCHVRKIADSRFFAKKKSSFDGLAPTCKECNKEVKNGKRRKAK